MKVLFPGGPLAGALVLFALSPDNVRAQANVNPDISVIPRFLITSSDGQKLAEGKREFSRPDFQFQELELSIGSYLNPFSRADVILTLPGPDVEASKLGVEEMYATVFRGLPLDLNLRVGKYRAEFGKLNQMHPHAWPFISAPLVQQRFLGEEGLNDLGISASVLLPTGDVYTKLTADLLRGKAVGGTTGLVDTTGAPPLYANSMRLTSFFSLTDNSDLEVGLSGYTGIHDPYYHDRFWYGNLDVKYKYRPDSYTSLVVQGEALFNSRTAHQDAALTPFRDPGGVIHERTIASNGGYLFTDYQFFKTYSVGARYDWAGTPYNAGDRAHGFAVFAGYYPVEETIGVRLEYTHTTTESAGAPLDVNTIGLQVLFSLGPHKAHPF
jgi:hypothetical protein